MLLTEYEKRLVLVLTDGRYHEGASLMKRGGRRQEGEPPSVTREWRCLWVGVLAIRAMPDARCSISFSKFPPRCLVGIILYFA